MKTNNSEYKIPDWKKVILINFNQKIGKIKMKLLFE